MNKNLMIFGFVLTLFILAGRDVFAGALDPTNSPGPTMHTLEELWNGHEQISEKITGVSDGIGGMMLGVSNMLAQIAGGPMGAQQGDPRLPIDGLPYTITNSGSYYVTGNLESSSHGIVIIESQVTLDLMGFSLTGDASSGDYGIFVMGESNAVIKNVLIKGGSISEFGEGLYCKNMNNSRIEQLAISKNTDGGIIFDGSNSAQCNGNMVSGCSITESYSAISLNGSFSGECNGNTVSGCSITESSGTIRLDGQWSGQASGNTIENCSLIQNSSFGIALYGDGGTCAGNRVQKNQLDENYTAGIALYYADANKIEANHVTGTTGNPSYGILTHNSWNNVILKNTCIGQTDNFNLDPDDTYGPIVTNTGALTSTGDSSHPWANFSR